VKKLSEKLQELLLEYILYQKQEFSIPCDSIEKIRKLFLALGRNVVVKEKKGEECVIMVYYHVS